MYYGTAPRLSFAPLEITLYMFYHSTVLILRQSNQGCKYVFRESRSEQVDSWHSTARLETHFPLHRGYSDGSDLWDTAPCVLLLP